MCASQWIFPEKIILFLLLNFIYISGQSHWYPFPMSTTNAVVCMQFRYSEAGSLAIVNCLRRDANKILSNECLMFPSDSCLPWIPANVSVSGPCEWVIRVAKLVSASKCIPLWDRKLEESVISRGNNFIFSSNLKY